MGDSVCYKKRRQSGQFFNGPVRSLSCLTNASESLMLLRLNDLTVADEDANSILDENANCDADKVC